MLISLLYFLLAGVTLTAIIWAASQLFVQQDDFLNDRLEELRSAG